MKFVALKRAVHAVSVRRPIQPDDDRYVGLEHIQSWTGKILPADGVEPEGLVGIFKSGDILFGKLRPYLAKVAGPDFDGVCSTEALILRPLSEVSGRFLRYVIGSKDFIDRVNSATFGTKMPRASWENIGRELVPLPDLAAQKQIADFLDTETARIDALIEKKQRFHEIVVEREEASFLDAVTGRNLICDRQPSGVRWIGELPSGWLAPKFTQVARQETGHTPSRKEPSYWIPEDCVIPWVSLADVWQLRSGEAVYLADTAEKISEFGMANSSARLLPKDTVILSRTASVGFVAIMATDMATTQDFAAWIPGPKVRSKFLYYVLRAMKPEFRRLMMGSTHQTIYMPDIRSFRTPLPPLPEQDRIIAALDASIGTYRQVNTKIQTSITRLREYRAALITAAVTGQIDVTAHARHDASRNLQDDPSPVVVLRGEQSQPMVTKTASFLARERGQR